MERESERGKDASTGAGESSGHGGKGDGYRRQGELKNGYQQHDLRQQSTGKWQTHQSKHTKKREAAKKRQWCPKVQVTSYFIYNLPDEINEQDLVEAYKSFGDLFTTHIPSKKDSCGNRFGFVRYRNVGDKLAFEKTLVNVKLRGAIIGVNLSRHDRMLLNSPQNSNNSNKVYPTQKSNEHSHFAPPKQQPKSTNFQSHGSFRDILTNQNSTKQSSKTIILNPSEPSYISSWKDSSIVMEAKTLDILNDFNSVCKAMGFKEHSIRYLGGMSILVSFGKSEAMEAIAQNKAIWEPYVKSISKWDFSYKQKERIAWLYIRGVPAHLCNQETFELIANSYGSIIKPSEAAHNDAILSYDYIGISTTQPQRICENILIKWRSESYSLTIEEEVYQWYPSFLTTGQSPEKESSTEQVTQQTCVLETETVAVNSAAPQQATSNSTPNNKENNNDISMDTEQEHSNVNKNDHSSMKVPTYSITTTKQKETKILLFRSI